MNLEASAIIIAITQAAKAVAPASVHGVVSIVVAAVVGLVLAVIRHADPITGIFEGLVAAGIITTASRIGK